MSQTTVDTAAEGSARNGERERPPERQGTECPECTGSIRHDAEHGERTCTECGLVLDADAIDYGPEWLCLDDEEDRRRVGPPVSSIKHDRGLSTTIGWRDEDAYGNRVSERKRERLRRLRTWNERFSSKNAQERNLKQAFGEIERMASALGLPEPCRETAGVLYRRAVDEDLLPGRSIEAMATACLYAARGNTALPGRSSRSNQSVASRRSPFSARIGTSRANSGYGSSPPTRSTISHSTRRRSRSATTPNGWPARYSRRPSPRSPQRAESGRIGRRGDLRRGPTDERTGHPATVGEETGVSSVTVRNRYRELLDAYEEGRDRR